MEIQTLDTYHQFSAYGQTGENLPEAIPLPNLAHIIYQWKKAIDHHEHASIYYFGMATLHRRLMQLSRHKEMIQDVFGKKCVYIIDVETWLLSDPEDYERVFSMLPKTPSVVCLIGMDKPLRLQAHSIFTFLERYIQTTPHSFLFFYSVDFLHPDWHLPLTASNLFQNIIFHPIPMQEEAAQFMRYLGALWDVSIDEEFIAKTIQKTGAYFLFVKQAMRHVRDGSSLETLYSSDQMESKKRFVWNSLLESEQSVMKKIVTGESTFDPIESHSAQFLLKTGWLRQTKGKYVMSIPLLHSYISAHYQTARVLTVDALGSLCLNQVPITDMFSSQEAKLIAYLIAHTEVLISRDAIARVLWESNWEDKYSDWAIDRIVFRLRSKLAKLRIPHTIQTIKGKGIVYSSKYTP